MFFSAQCTWLRFKKKKKEKILQISQDTKQHIHKEKRIKRILVRYYLNEE